MLIYQPSVFCFDEIELNQATSFLAQKLFPSGKLLSTPSGSNPSSQLLRAGSLLVEFQLYTCDLGDEAFETILKTATHLETKRREQHDPSLLDISVCLAAFSFSRDLLARFPSGLIRVSMFQWEFIRSGKEEAILLREIKNNFVYEKEVVHHDTPTLKYPIEEKEPSTSVPINSPELSTPELVAFARLGMELRNRKPKAGVV
jgi:hypothetical protein